MPSVGRTTTRIFSSLVPAFSRPEVAPIRRSLWRLSLCGPPTKSGSDSRIGGRLSPTPRRTSMAKAKLQNVNVNEYVGELRVTGEIDLAQFWPNKKSDADTVAVQATNFEFSPDPKTKPFKKTTVFQGAWIGKSKGKRQLVVHKGGKITIRLQGIDATELHFKEYFKSGLKGNVEYRQFLAETATTKLHDFLAGGGGSKVACRVTTRVDLPNQAAEAPRTRSKEFLIKKFSDLRELRASA